MGIRKKICLILEMVAMILIISTFTKSVTAIEDDQLIQLPSQWKENEVAENFFHSYSRKMFKGIGSAMAMARCPSGSCFSDADCGPCKCKTVSISPFIYTKCA